MTINSPELAFMTPIPDRISVAMNCLGMLFVSESQRRGALSRLDRYLPSIEDHLLNPHEKRLKLVSLELLANYLAGEIDFEEMNNAEENGKGTEKGSGHAQGLV